MQEGKGLGGLLHPGVQVADDRFDPPDDLALEFQVEPEHAVGGGVLRSHVDDHPLVVGHRVVDHPIVDHPGAPLLDGPVPGLIPVHLLDALAGAGHHPFGDLRGLGSRHPDVGGGGRLGHQITWWDSLNWTGTVPTPKSRRSGWPSQSSGISIRVRSGWSAKRIPNMS